MTVWTDWNISLDIMDILSGQGMDPKIILNNKPRLMATAGRALNNGLELIHPAALTSEIAIQSRRHERMLLEGGGLLTGSLVMRHLAGALRVIAVICTIGQELENAISYFLGTDPLYALALDGLGNAAVESLAQQVCSRIGEKIRDEGLQVSTPLSPGAADWPAEIGQPQIFSLIAPSQAGIRLTPGGMMIPKKSMSFVVGLGLEMSQANLCDECSLKETCRYQHA